MSQARLSGIQVGGSFGEYVVSLADNDGAKHRFLMVVTPGPIEAVVWEQDFAIFMQMNMAPARQLFEAVLAFHTAALIEGTSDLPQQP